MTAPLLPARRDILRAGLLGGAMLAGGATLASLAGCSGTPRPATGFRALRDSDVALLRPLVPAVLGPAVTSEADVERVLQLLDRTLAATTAPIRKGFFQLYDLLQLGPARWWLTGTRAHPSTLDAAALRDGLAHWEARDNWFAKIAFRGLTQPLAMVWYAAPDAAAGVGYPGAPKKVIT